MSCSTPVRAHQASLTEGDMDVSELSQEGAKEQRLSQASSQAKQLLDQVLESALYPDIVELCQVLVKCAMCIIQGACFNWTLETLLSSRLYMKLDCLPPLNFLITSIYNGPGT